MKYVLSWTAEAAKNVSSLPEHIGKRVVAKMQWYVALDNPLSFAKRLQAPAQTLYRFRIGDYRTIVTIEKDAMHVLLVLSVKNRKDAYKDL